MQACNAEFTLRNMNIYWYFLSLMEHLVEILPHGRQGTLILHSMPAAAGLMPHKARTSDRHGIEIICLKFQPQTV